MEHRKNLCSIFISILKSTGFSGEGNLSFEEKGIFHSSWRLLGNSFLQICGLCRNLEDYR